MRQQEAAQKSLAAISSILLLHMQTKSENCLDFKRKWGGEELINEREKERGLRYGEFAVGGNLALNPTQFWLSFHPSVFRFVQW